jgi:hypothetical protein
MNIETFIKNNVLLPRAEHARALVVYDPELRYRDLVLGMSSEKIRVIDAKESVIVARSLAALALLDLGARRIETLIIWAPTPRPISDEARRIDPFASVAAVGTVFPVGAADAYKSLCLSARPENAVSIHKLFEAPTLPTFAMINALGGGTQFVQLQAALGLSHPDTRAIFEGLLNPNEDQIRGLAAASWMAEAKQCIHDVLGLVVPEGAKDLNTLQSFLWLAVLFSEFYFDSSRVDLPKSLASVPRAEDAAEPFIYQLCDGLRVMGKQDAYIKWSNRIAEQLRLEHYAAEMTSLGERDTFAFEEVYFMNNFIAACKAKNWTHARKVVDDRRRSMWINVEEFESRKVEWEVAGRALDLLEKINTAEYPNPELALLVEAYVSKLYLIDRLHRYLEKSLADRVDHHQGLDEVVASARAAYAQFAQRLHGVSLAAVQSGGWPLRGLEYVENSELFDKVVEPLLQSREPNRVAYILIDSLRFELARDLEQQLLKRYRVDLKVSCAQLPTYTEIGMASLMPKAKANLALRLKDDELLTYLGDVQATDPQKRFSWVRKVKGDCCQDITIDEILSKHRPAINDNINLLIVRSTSIDAAAHESEGLAMRLIPSMLNDIQKALRKLQDFGFTHAVIATDHGFMLNMVSGAGTNCAPPEGEWIKRTSRCLLGRGTPDSANVVIPRAQLGIQGDFEHFATPNTLTSYGASRGYFHEGISLQENILPRMVVTLIETPAARTQTMEITALYKRGKTNQVTTRRPFIDVAWSQAEMFATETELQVLVRDANGKEIGSVVQGEFVNPSTLLLRIRPGQVSSVCLRLDESFSGPFTVTIVDPMTQQTYDKLELETQFHR